MTTSCAYFSHLEIRLSELKVKFLQDQMQEEAQDPVNFSPDLDNIAAFKLLMHAEIEDFLELKAKENLKAIESQILPSSNVIWSRMFPELFYIVIIVNRHPECSIFDIPSLKNFTKEIITSAKSIIAENNGIKENSFNKLSVFAGKTPDEIDSTLLSDLNSYGKNRGDIAHKSVKHVTNINSPSTEYTSAESLVNQIGKYFNISS